MSRSPSILTGALASEDTEVMIAALRLLGCQIDVSPGGERIEFQRTALSERSREPESELLEMFIANSGTSIRFLAAALSAYGGRYRLLGVPRMHQRPIGDLVDAISQIMDGQIVAESPGQCPPVRIESRGWRSDQVRVAGSVSSQFLSGLMMAAPIAGALRAATAPSSPLSGVRISVVGELVSRPYVDMTADVMRSFGAEVQVMPGDPDRDESLAVLVGDRPYQGLDYAIEPDASAASYFWAAAAITGGSIKVLGLTSRALQGDVGFCDVLHQMGCEVREDEDGMTVSGRALRGIDVDMNQISDTVQTLAMVALFAEGPTRVRGVAHNRFKETDRIGDLARELRKLGAEVHEHDDGLTIHPASKPYRGATLQTYHDHRMAMSLSLAGLRMPEVRIVDPACTAKTYPEFFADLETLTGRPHHWSGR
jgi:3-phosphoshikimate 1-carboxyvinyltransferase